LYILDILFVDLLVVFGDTDTAAIVEALNVRAGDADVDAANHDVAFLFSVDNGFVDALHRRLEIDNLAFAPPPRRGLADPQNLNRAVRFAFADHDANFRGSNF